MKQYQTLLREHYFKIMNSIKSCTTKDHLIAIGKIIENYINYWKHKISNITIKYYVNQFMISFEFKIANIKNNV